MNPFGPIFPYDLIRMARRGRYIWLRALYCLGLLGLMYLTYRSQPFGEFAPPQMLAAFAEKFFFLFMFAQFIVVLLITPAYVGDAISEEKERQTIDYLLTTHLKDREIVFGKLASRLVNVTLFLLAGLPILSLTQLFGGVSPELLWGGFVVTLLTIFSVAGISLVQSLYARKSRNAILLAYLVILCFFVLWGVGEYLSNLATRPALAVAPTRPVMGRYVPPKPPPPPVWHAYLLPVLEGFRAGNPVAMVEELNIHVRAGGKYGDIILDLLAKYALIHGTVGLLCIGWVAWRLRRVVAGARSTAPTANTSGLRLLRRRNAGAVPARRTGNVWRHDYRLNRLLWCLIGTALLFTPLLVAMFEALFSDMRGPTLGEIIAGILAAVALPALAAGTVTWRKTNRRRSSSTVGDRPMMWKELHAESGFGLGWLGKLLLLVLAMSCLVPCVPILLSKSMTGFRAQLDLNIHIRLVGALVGSVALLAVGVRAAGSIGAERDRQTWDGLLASPLTNREILFAKWCGSLWSARWLVALLGTVWTVGISGRALSVLAVPLELFCLAIFGSFMASLGLLLGVCSKTTLRAVVGTVFAGLFFGGGPWLCVMLLTAGNPAWTVPAMIAVLGGSAAFLSSPLLALGMWIKNTFLGIRGLIVAVYLMCAFPLAGYFIVLGLLENGSGWTFTLWEESVTNGITPPIVLADCAYFELPRDTGYFLPSFGYWARQEYFGGGIRILCRALGLTAFALMAFLLWLVAQSRFYYLCGRIEGKRERQSAEWKMENGKRKMENGKTNKTDEASAKQRIADKPAPNA